MDYTIDRRGWQLQPAYDFQEYMAPVSSFPMAYVYATFLGISGHILGRNAYLMYGAHEMYTNQYIALLGGSGTHHKSTALKAAMRLQGTERLEATPPLRALTTEQGLLTAMNNTGGHALVVLDEIANMLSKKKQDFGASLLSQLVNLYDCPDEAGNYTKYDPTIVTEPYVTFMSASTMEWLRDSLSTNDMLAGFGNRMTWVLGDPRKPKAFPTPINTVDAPEIFNQLEMFSGEVVLTEEARDRWEHHYYEFLDIQKASPPFLQVMAERLTDKALKAAIINAAWDDSHYIEIEHLERGIDWTNYLHDCLKVMLPTFGSKEQTILASLSNGRDTKRKLYNEHGHKAGYTADTIKRSLDSLLALGVIATAGKRYVIVDKPE